MTLYEFEDDDIEDFEGHDLVEAPKLNQNLGNQGEIVFKGTRRS